MCSSPLSFTVPQLSDAAMIRPLIAESQAMANDLSFANIFLLQEKYKTTIACRGGFVFRHYGGQGRIQGYAFPCGKGDTEWALKQIEADAICRQRPCHFCLLTEADAAMLRQLRPNMYDYTTDPGDADYVYCRQDLVDLPGTAFHKKRNHVARFERLFPHWRFAPLNDSTQAAALAVAELWYAARTDHSPALLHEQKAIHSALRHARSLGLMGGVLFVDETPVAMSLASQISPNVVDIHYEKCLPDFRDAYPIINREMARSLPGRWLNREEDLNQPGLRQAKLSYRPALLLQKFNACPRSKPC